MSELFAALEDLKSAIAQLEVDIVQNANNENERVLRAFLKAGVNDIGKAVYKLQFINLDTLP